MTIDTNQFLFSAKASLAKHPTLWTELEDAPEQLESHIKRLRELQELLYADNRRSVLAIFQGMDAAGKDSTIKHVTSGVNPMGFQVFSFKQPTHKELDHNYLWRYWRALPERGRIGIFNRSYYEEVGVVRVHPELLEQRNLPLQPRNSEFWEQRLEDVRGLERHLTAAGTLVLKFFLNVSKSEQKSRLISRLERPSKHWKFDPKDVEEREHWDTYQHVWQQALSASHCDDAPWFVIPADHKWTMRAIVAQIVSERMRALDLQYPKITKQQKRNLSDALRRLASQDDG
jgi:PPK2 family polyphosphate:nucleotide phosphotransferase